MKQGAERGGNVQKGDFSHEQLRWFPRHLLQVGKPYPHKQLRNAGGVLVEYTQSEETVLLNLHLQEHIYEGKDFINRPKETN